MTQKQFTFKQFQHRIRENKKNKGLPLDDPFVDLAWINEELGEISMALRRHKKEGVIEECVDVIILALGLFEMYQKDGYEEVYKKMVINEKRHYEKLGEYNVRSKEAEVNKEEIQVNLKNQLTFRELQERIWENKKAKNFNLDKPELDAVCMFEEAAEAAWALRHKDDEKLMDALADLIIYALGLLRMFRVDAHQALLAKVEINEGRASYQGEGREIFRPDFGWE